MLFQTSYSHAKRTIHIVQFNYKNIRIISKTRRFRIFIVNFQIKTYAI